MKLCSAANRLCVCLEFRIFDVEHTANKRNEMRVNDNSAVNKWFGVEE